MRGEQRAFTARARKSSRLEGIVFRPICLSCAGRLFIGVIVLVGELIVGLQVVRCYIERLQFRVTTEIHRRGNGGLLGPLPSAKDESDGSSAWGVALHYFPDSTMQF